MAKPITSLLVGMVLGIQGARVSRKGSPVPVDVAKTLAGVPVLNYQTAYGGQAATGQREHWVVVGKRGVDDKTLERLCESSGSCDMQGHPSEGGVPFFKVYCTEQELEKVLSIAPQNLEFAQPDGLVHIPESDMGASPAQAKSWGLDRVGAANRDGTGKDVHIYVLDTGVRVTHNDFGSRAAPALDLTVGPIKECASDDLTCAGDSQGHGTHCAGTAAGTEYGVAIDAKVYGVKVLSDSGSGQFSWSYAALDWLASSANAQRPNIASMSLGGRGVDPGIETAVDSAVEAGVTVVVAGGNSNMDACGFSPAYVDTAITVGSTTSTDRRSSFSNYGRCTEIWAPGSDITSASHNSDTGAATFSGTSMACPHVSGAAALVLEANPAWKSAEVLAELLNRSEKDAIADLRAGDTNKLLWVAVDPAPVPAPTPAPPPRPTCPDFAANREPDRDGDCTCPGFQRCSTDGRNVNCPTSGADGGYGGRYFFYTCTNCKCYSGLR
jgi:subtilisin family serine protease